MIGKRSRQPLRLFALWQLLGVGMLAYIVYASLMPHPLTISNQIPDPFYHFLGYFLLTAWYAQLYADSRNRYLQALLFAILGILLECAQLLVNERSFEMIDMLANGSGVLAAWLLTRGRLSKLLLHFEKKVLSAE